MTMTMLMINFRLMDGEIAGGADALLVALVGAVLEDIDFWCAGHGSMSLDATGTLWARGHRDVFTS